MDRIGHPYIHPTDAPDTGAGGRLRFSIISGGGSAADLTLTGMHVDDQIVKVTEFTKSGGNVTGLVDRTGSVMAIKTNAFQLSGTPTTGGQLEVCWLDKRPS